MIEITLQDNYSAALAALPDRLHQALSDKANALAAQLAVKVQQKLSGDVLNQKSGALARSIVTTIDDSSADISVTVASNGDVKYAAIHAFGGVIAPHEIVPDKARALAFVVGGKQVFAAHVNLPAITMPERSYLRSSLAEMADEIKEGLSEVVVEASK
jgi:phage gpG-like protein